MLKVVFNEDGSIKELVVMESINQGSNNVNKIFASVLGRSVGDYTCVGEFELPSGELEELNGEADSQEVGQSTLNGYTISLAESVTREAGNLKLNLKLIDLQSNVLCTYQVTLKVNPTGYQPNDTHITEAQYNALLLSLNSYLLKLDFQDIIDNYYTKTEVNTLLESYYTTNQVDSLLALKVNTSELSNYYTKSQTDTLLAGKQKVLTAGAGVTITEEGLISATTVISLSGPYESLEELREEHPIGANNVIYLITDSHAISSNLYDEYIWASDHYEKIGSIDTNVDLSDYYTKTEAVAALANAEEITYSELVALRSQGKLVAGRQYRITDYECTPNYTGVTSAGHQFDIIVTAISSNVLSEEAKAIQHEGDTYFANCDLIAWKVWYSLENDTSRFAWADSTNGKGVIYRLIDEWNNDCPYDFKNILYSGYYTFDYWYSSEALHNDASIIGNGVVSYAAILCYNNKIEPYYSPIAGIKYALSYIRFIAHNYNYSLNGFGLFQATGFLIQSGQHNLAIENVIPGGYSDIYTGEKIIGTYKFGKIQSTNTPSEADDLVRLGYLNSNYCKKLYIHSTKIGTGFGGSPILIKFIDTNPNPYTSAHAFGEAAHNSLMRKVTNAGYESLVIQITNSASSFTVWNTPITSGTPSFTVESTTYTDTDWTNNENTDTVTAVN